MTDPIRNRAEEIIEWISYRGLHDWGRNTKTGKWGVDEAKDYIESQLREVARETREQYAISDDLIEVAADMARYASNFHRDADKMADPVANDPMGYFIDVLKGLRAKVAREAEIRVWNEANAIAITTMDEEGDAPEFETDWGRGHRMACTQIQVALRAKVAALESEGGK